MRPASSSNRLPLAEQKEPATSGHRRGLVGALQFLPHSAVFLSASVYGCVEEKLFPSSTALCDSRGDRPEGKAATG